MDYTTQSLTFRVKKLLRYFRLYGLRRTLIKVKGQYHMKKQYDPLPVQPDTPEVGGHVGLIGCGNFQFSNVAYYLKKNYGRVIRGAMDIDTNRAASLYEEYGLRYYTSDANRIISDPSIDLIYIASNHASHAEYAIDALKAGKDVHIEKPHCVSEAQLRRLLKAMSESDGRVLSVGYNRPMSRIGKTIKHYLGTQTGAAMLNWFVAGHELDPDHWYFQEAEGGRVLGNLCHWTDFSYNMIDEHGRYPLRIIPTRSDKSDCDIAVTYVFGPRAWTPLGAPRSLVPGRVRSRRLVRGFSGGSVCPSIRGLRARVGGRRWFGGARGSWGRGRVFGSARSGTCVWGVAHSGHVPDPGEVFQGGGGNSLLPLGLGMPGAASMRSSP